MRRAVENFHSLVIQDMSNSEYRAWTLSYMLVIQCEFSDFPNFTLLFHKLLRQF